MGHSIRDDVHDLTDAMANCGMDPDELWFVIRCAAHHGYKETMRRLSVRGALAHARRWLCWFGGWEAPDIALMRGEPAWRFGRSPTPVALFGHRVVVYGRWGDVRIGGGVLVWRWGEHVYWSPDGTPSHPDAFDIIGHGCERGAA